jgi:hypothetical protein
VGTVSPVTYDPTALVRSRALYAETALDVAAALCLVSTLSLVTLVLVLIAHASDFAARRLFLAIKPQELLLYAQVASRPSEEIQVAPRLHDLKRRFDELGRWASTEILLTPVAADRAFGTKALNNDLTRSFKVMDFFVQLCGFCMDPCRLR